MDASETIKPSLRDFLYIVFKRKAQILVFFCSTVFVVTLITFLMEPTYEASSQILVKVGRENVYVPASGKADPIIRVDREEQLNSEMEILKGWSLAKKVVKAIGPTTIYKDLKIRESKAQGAVANANPQEMFVNMATQSLQEELEVKGIKKSSVIEISFKHHNPRMAALVVNDLVKFFLDRHLEVHRNPQSHKFFKEQSQAYKERLRKTETSLQTLKAKYDVTSLKEELQIYLAQEAKLENDFNQTIVQEAETKTRVIQIRRQLGKIPETITQQREVVTNSRLIADLVTRLVGLEIKESELIAKYADQNRLVRNVKAEIQIVRKKLKEQEEKNYGKTLYGPNAAYQRLQEELFQNEANLTASSAKKIAQNAQLVDYRNKIVKLNQIEMELNQLKNQSDVDQENYRLYLTKFEESRISNAMDAEKIANVSSLGACHSTAEAGEPKSV